MKYVKFENDMMLISWSIGKKEKTSDGLMNVKSMSYWCKTKNQEKPEEEKNKVYIKIDILFEE